MLTFHEIMIIDDRYLSSNLSEARTFNFIYTDFELLHPDPGVSNFFSSWSMIENWVSGEIVPRRNRTQEKSYPT